MLTGAICGGVIVLYKCKGCGKFKKDKKFKKFSKYFMSYI